MSEKKHTISDQLNLTGVGIIVLVLGVCFFAGMTAIEVSKVIWACG